MKATPKGNVTLRIRDARGQTVRTLEGPKQPGINRVWWDMRGELSKEIRLRTSPAYEPHVRVGPEGWRPLPGGGQRSVLAPPGAYTVTLQVDGQDLSQPLAVRKDPNTAGTEADIQAQVEMLLGIRSDLDSVAEMVNLVEVIRTQLESVKALLGPDEKAAPLRKAAEALDGKLVDLEEHFIPRDTRLPPALVSKLTYLADGASMTDFPPTNQQREVHALFRQRIATDKEQLDALVRRDLAAFNELLRASGIPHVVATTRDDSPGSIRD